MMKIRRGICAVLVLLSCLMLLAGCGGQTVPGEAVVNFDADSDSAFYFYGVVKSGKTYYVKVLDVYAEDPAEADFMYAPLADEIYASFQPDGWVGAWSPNDYHTPAELAAAAKKGEITEGVLFTYSLNDGRMEYLYEYNYYADNDVTGG